MKPDSSRYYVPIQKHGRFECHIHEVKEGFLLCTAQMLAKSFFSRINPWHKESASWVSHQDPIERSTELAITWIGHSTVLIQIAGINIITDPIFGHPSFLYPRIMPPGIAHEKLPPIDAVLISHNHPDHMDAKSIQFIADRYDPQFLVPHGDKRWFLRRNITNVYEFLWWHRHSITTPSDTEVKFTFLPAVHWTQRGIFDRNRSLWGSWMIEYKKRCIYFAGDTASGVHFSTIAHEFPSIDVAILPIGPCEPRNFMKHSHMDACEAGQAFLTLKARHLFPVHWGTFHFGNELAALPMQRLNEWWADRQPVRDDDILHAPLAGARVDIAAPRIKIARAPAVHIQPEDTHTPPAHWHL